MVGTTKQTTHGILKHETSTLKLRLLNLVLVGRSILSLLNVFCNLSRCKKQSVYIATAFVNIPNGIVVFAVGNAINVEPSMCVCFKESFEKFFGSSLPQLRSLHVVELQQ